MSTIEAYRSTDTLRKSNQFFVRNVLSITELFYKKYNQCWHLYIQYILIYQISTNFFEDCLIVSYLHVYTKRPVTIHK